MNKLTINNIIICSILGILFLIAVSLPFSIYGQDGYYLWYPVIAEYLNGDKIYHSSAVIFNGQNLASVYGELPFWKIFREIQLSIPRFLNLTHFIWTLCFFFLIRTIIKGIKTDFKPIDVLACFLFSFFSPVVMNRIMAGHFNLLYGMLPFFTAVALIFDKSWRSIVLLILCNWFAFSMQGYQIISYHLFYAPILFLLLNQYEEHYKKYALLFLLISTLPFAMNLPVFLQMMSHAKSGNNLRALGENVVYSYLTSTPADLWNLVLVSKNELTMNLQDGFFHEMNYGIGAFALYYFNKKNWDRISLSLGALIIILFLFSMNLPPFNLLADLPLIKSFRVPQRSLMIPILFLPIWFYAKQNVQWNKFEILGLVALILVGLKIPAFDIVVVILVLILFAVKENEKLKLQDSIFQKILLAFCLASICAGSTKKLAEGYKENKNFSEIQTKLKPLIEKYSLKERRRRVFHFEVHSPLEMNYVAQTLGFRTMEGYGHPPQDLLLALQQTENISISRQTNVLFFPFNSKHQESTWKMFTIDSVVSFDDEGKLVERVLNP